MYYISKILTRPYTLSKGLIPAGLGPALGAPG